MHKKSKVAETSFVSRSMISSVSEDDHDIMILGHVFKSILKHEDFVEFNMSPLQKRKKAKDLNSLEINLYDGSQTLNVKKKNPIFIGNNPTEKRVLNFFDQITQLESEDQEFFMTKLESLTKSAKDHMKPIHNSPSKFVSTAIHNEQESGNISEELILKLNTTEKVTEQEYDMITPFKDASYKDISIHQFNEKIDGEDDDEDDDLEGEEDKESVALKTGSKIK
jgi:hypothetical protein